jgi:predicted peptidase
MFLFQEVRNYIINQRREVYSTNTQTDHLQQQQQQQDLGNIIIIPLSNKIGEKKKKKHTPYKIYGPEGYVHKPTLQPVVVLLCR